MIMSESGDNKIKPISAVAIYGSRRQEGHIDDIKTLLDTLRGRGIEVYVERKLADLLNEEGYRLALHGVKSVTRFPEGADLVMSIGGDGTFLRTAKWMGGREMPVLGINTGHLGFLAENTVADGPRIVEALTKGEYSEERRLVLQAKFEGADDVWPFALNEVAFLKADSASMISVRVEVDGDFLADYSADGLIMATPTGSTAYNLSVGGPILEPTLQNVVLSPIAPHTLTLRPIVVGADSRITAVVTSRKKDFRLSIDGRSVMLPCGEKIIIERAPHSVVTLRKRGENFAHTLRNKFSLGINQILT